MARMSNKERIARAAAEAQIGDDERAAAVKKMAKKKGEAVPVRTKIVWAVCDPAGKSVKTFPYPQKEAAEAEVAALTKKKERPYCLRADKVPMD